MRSFIILSLLIELAWNNGLLFILYFCGKSTLFCYHNEVISSQRGYFAQNTALHLAAKAGQVSAVTTLLDMNASFLRNDDGATCFTEAIVNENREVALLIVQVVHVFSIIDGNSPYCATAVRSKTGLENMRPAGRMRHARAFSIVKKFEKAVPRISNCRSRISSILQRDLYVEIK